MLGLGIIERPKIVLVPFPFTDLTAVKLRPAPVLFGGERDVVVAFISSRIPMSQADGERATGFSLREA